MVWHQTHSNGACTRLVSSCGCEIMMDAQGRCVSIGPFGRAQDENLMQAIGRCEKGEAIYQPEPETTEQVINRLFVPKPYQIFNRCLYYNDANGTHYIGEMNRGRK